jgi:hypothetical protein
MKKNVLFFRMGRLPILRRGLATERVLGVLVELLKNELALKMASL